MSFMEALRKTVKYKGRKQEITRNSQFRVNHLEYRAAWKLLFAMCSDNNGRAQDEPVCTLPVGAEVPATTLPGRHGHSSRLPAVWLPSVHEIFRWTSWGLASGQVCVGKSLLPPVTPSQPGGWQSPALPPQARESEQASSALQLCWFCFYGTAFPQSLTSYESHPSLGDCGILHLNTRF